MRTLRRAFPVLLVLVLALPLEAQRRETARLGISVGGISTVGVVVEYVDGHGSTELNVGTFSFRDLSVSLVRRHYLGVADARPTIGLGVWGVLAFPPDERMSTVLILRAPVGVDWRFGGDHALVFDINVNRGLWIRRSDPEDETPLNRRLIPLPGLSYRWRNR